MTKHTKKTADTMTYLGFALLFCGAILALLLDTNWILRAIGIVLIIGAAALFSGSLAIRKK